MDDPDKIEDILTMFLMALLIPTLIYILFFAEYPDE